MRFYGSAMRFPHIQGAFRQEIVVDEAQGLRNPASQRSVQTKALAAKTPNLVLLSGTPIINAPEVAILGVSKSSMKPVWNGKEFTPRLVLPLSLSYDHRVIDGAAGARFTTYLVSVLSDIRRSLL